MRRLVALAASLALSLACQGDDWIIAGERREDAREPRTDAQPPEVVGDPSGCPSAADVLGQRRERFGAPSVAPEDVGRWSGDLGDAAAAGFPARAVVLDIAASGAGTLTIGPVSDRSAEASPLDQGYLCEELAQRVVCGSSSGFVGGFPYPIEGAQSRGGVLSFTVLMGDPWGPWCARHSPLPADDARQECGFSFGVLPPGEPQFSPAACSRTTPEGAEPIDCALMYALEYCACARDACFGSLTRSVEVGLARAPDGSSLRGSLWYENELEAAPLALARVP